MTPRTILVGLLALLILVAGLIYVSTVGNVRNAGQGGVACTTEAKKCPDGSYVGRTGPNCEFAACPPATSPGSGAGGGILPHTSGIRGRVALGPTCPVERVPPDPQCADKGYATAIQVFRASDTVHAVATTQSDAQGVFEVSVAPGEYVLAAQGGSTLPRCPSVDVTVAPDAYTSAAVRCDTGIR